jgi:hypothetical protein
LRATYWVALERDEVSDEMKRRREREGESRWALIGLPNAYKGLVVWGTSGGGGSHILGGRERLR